ncbi:MAG: hypothetical protein KVP17_000721 [Porospora cf. gigantea B]|uniref:uncharacterized protein n=1 Tax=Porospora cf. gigantea B TaxID=2853592 RepID=UPI003571EB0C|nr:MAG: hypothetical protein KVP17_000721 [Porospora cf. gigantea B]
MMVQSKPVELQPGDEVVVVNPNDLTTMVQAQPKVWIVQEATRSAASIRQADDPDKHDIVSTNRLKKLPKSRIQAQVTPGGAQDIEGDDSSSLVIELSAPQGP